MPRRALPPGTKQRALALIASGMDQTKIAAEVGVSVSSINKWSKEGGKPDVQGSGTSGDSTAGGNAVSAESGISPITEGPGPDLSTLVATHPTKPIGAEGIGAEGQGMGALPPPGPPPPKPIDPEALIAVAQVAKAMVVTTVAGIYKVQLSEKESAVLCGFSEPERKSLELLAPYAAEYSGEMGNYAKPVMALLFVGAVGFSTVNSIKAIKSKAPPKSVNVMKKAKK